MKPALGILWLPGSDRRRQGRRDGRGGGNAMRRGWSRAGVESSALSCNSVPKEIKAKIRKWGC